MSRKKQNLGYPGKGLYLSSELEGRYSKYKLFIENKEGQSREKTVSELSYEPIKPHATKEINVDDTPEYFIVPDENAQYLSDIKPFDFYPDILTDFIELAEKLKRVDGIDAAETILAFCNKYGLFNISGIYLNDCGESTFVDHDGDGYIHFHYDWGLLSESGIEEITREITIESGSTIYLKDYSKLFIPEEWIKNNELENDLGYTLLYNDVSESIHYAKIEVLKLYSKFERWFELKEDSSFPVSIEGHSHELTTNPISITVGYDKSLKIKWIYRSLIDALHIMFLVNIVEENQKVEFCNYDACQKPFITKKDNQLFCSSGCNNAARQKRWYDKHKKNREE